MLADSELLGLDSQLQKHILATKENQKNQDALLKVMLQLLRDYRQLRSDYEEEKESREKYKKLARGQDRDPFVLVLVDGDSYIFKDQFVKGGALGGISAAQALHDAVKEMMQSHLSSSEAENCRVMVRIYANLSGLSKSLAKAGLVGQEARSLAPFTSGFTGSYDLFDFVDVGDKKDSADFKIREFFRLVSDSSQCKHIFFAGCHDVGYVSLLTPYKGRADRFTLIKGPSYHAEFGNLDLPVRELRLCFRAAPLATNVTPSSPPPSKKGKEAANAGTKKACSFYQKGECKYGASCKNEHTNGPEKSEKSDESDSDQKREIQTALQLLEKYPALIDRSKPGSVVVKKPSTVLPSKIPEDAALLGLSIPVNKNNERLEVLCEKPDEEAYQAYNIRKEKHKVCNSHHLVGACRNGQDCELDHSQLSQPALTALRYIVKKAPCPEGSACRDDSCYRGHICQVDDCRGGSSCRFKADKHIQNCCFEVDQWVEPRSRTVVPAEPSAASSEKSVDSRDLPSSGKKENGIGCASSNTSALDENAKASASEHDKARADRGNVPLWQFRSELGNRPFRLIDIGADSEF